MNAFKSITLALITLAVISSCKKDDPSTPTQEVSKSTTLKISSLKEFYTQNGVPLQTHTIDATLGGSFTTPQGTKVTIQPNSLITQNNTPVTGQVTIQFKDIYKRSDMLLSDMPTTYIWGNPLKSGGEFFIKAIQGNNVLKISSGKKIIVEQPLNGWALDNAMQAMIKVDDAAVGDTAGANGWWISPTDTLSYNTSGYIFNLYQFSTPSDSGTWCNSDNADYFSAYQNTALTIHPLDDVTIYHPDVFLVFKDVNSMVHVYNNGVDFPYYYAPVSLQCTVVAIGVKDNKLYSSFVPITITNNLTVNFALSETTTEAFKTQLDALN